MSKPRRLAVEGLENRALLAGNVSVSVSGAGVLTVTGDNAGNGVSIQQIDSGKYFVTGFSVAGGATTINGHAQGSVVFGVTSDVNIDLNGGDDVFIMSQNAARRAVLAAQLSGGTAGPIAPSPQVANTNTTETSRTLLPHNLNVVTDDGNDGVGISARVGGVNNGGVAHIVTGTGADQVAIERSSALDDLLIETGDGNDTVTAAKIRVRDFLFANLGDGNDSINVNDYRGYHAHLIGGAGDDSITVHDFHTNLETFLYGQAGNDQIDATGVTASNLEIITHGGNDTVRLANSYLSGRLLIDTGASGDNVTVNHVRVAGPAIIDLGAGNDRLTVSNNTTEATTLEGGDGFDTFVDNGGNTFRNRSFHGFEA